MSDTIFAANCGSNIFCWVTGLIPSFASVAALIANWVVVTPSEH